MKKNITILLFVLNIIPSFGQKGECFCDKDTLMNNATVSCDTTTFTNGSKMYWQFNCDRIWLTLENIKKEKQVIDESTSELYDLTYRLGFHLIKEYKNTLLFRSGCPANGPCNHTLIDKTNGKKIKEFDQLICINTENQSKNPHKYEYNFIVSLSTNLDYLIVYFVDSKKTIKKPFLEKLTSVIPQSQFEKMTLKNNILTIYYEVDNCDKSKTITIDLKK
ncbi:MAG: hypothetical protein PHT07_15810 [Paludibacter sp.]|nr:hypothetical protein [Paludibacter sp.]